LPEKRRLLVARRARNRHAAEHFQIENMMLDLAVYAARRHCLWQHPTGDFETVEKLFVIVELMNIKEHRARSVGIVGHVLTGKVPDQPGIHGAEEQFAVFRALLAVFDMIEDVANLRAGKIRIDQKPGGLLHIIAPAFGNERFAERRRPAALPDNGVVDRQSGRLVPNDRGFALVGHTDGGNLARLNVFAPEHIRGGLLLRFQNVERVVLNVPRTGIDLAEFILRAADDFAFEIEQDCTGTRRALIKGEKILRHLNGSPLLN